MRQSKITFFFIALLIFLLPFLFSCTKEKRDRTDGITDFAPDGPATLSTMQTDFILLSCAVSGCHDNRANPSANLSLTTVEKTFNGMVNVDSAQAAGLKMVVPGDADNSYLVHKLKNTHLTVGGNGATMPQFAAPLTQGQIDRVVQWILDGAQFN